MTQASEVKRIHTILAVLALLGNHDAFVQPRSIRTCCGCLCKGYIVSNAIAINELNERIINFLII